MHTNLKRLSVFVIVMIFFAVMSAGCGGGGGGNRENVSQDNGNSNNINGWDTDPDEQNQNNNGNNNQDDNNNNNGNGDNQNDNNNNNGNNDNDNQNNNNGSPVAINGTWEIVSGEYTLSGEKTFSYLPGLLGTFEIIVKENTGNMYGGYASGFYTILLRGGNVTGFEDGGYTEISVPFDDNIPPADTTFFHAPLCGGRDFRYSSYSVMIETDEDFYNGEGYKGNTIYEKKYTLIDDSTIKYTYFVDYDAPGLAQTTDMTVELTLKRVK